MNSPDTESPTTPTVTPSNDSLLNCDLSTGEAPLALLTEKPLALMTEDELRERVKYFQQRRSSPQFQRAEIAREASADVSAGKVKAPRAQSKKAAEQQRLLDEYK